MVLDVFCLIGWTLADLLYYVLEAPTLYLSYQQQSDTVSVLFSNDLVGIKSWATWGRLRYVLDAEAQIDAHNDVFARVSVGLYRPDTCLHIHFFCVW